MADMMEEQMEFSGLVPDPNEIDPVSGNEIPLGSTAEGVRDDETAAISPGEFVIPEYAVNFHGIKFYIETLQLAQQGLQQIEQMGLVGNPDEEQIPDTTPLPDMAMAEEEGANQQAQFQTGGLFTAPLPQVPVQQPITSAPINPPVVPGIGPIRPVSTQPVPRVTTPSVQGVSPNRYQQGYYMDVGDGYYTYFPPPGVSSFGQSFRRDELPAGAIIAPPGTTRESVWGTSPGASQFKKTQTYDKLQGPGGGLPGGYKVEPFINDQGNILYLTTVGGEVQGGIPPGYRRAGSEELTGVTRRQDPRTTADVAPRKPPPDGGAGPDDFGVDMDAPASDPELDAEATEAFNAGMAAEIDAKGKGNVSLAFAQNLANETALAAYKGQEKGTVSKAASFLGKAIVPGATMLSAITEAPSQAIAAANQAIAHGMLGIPNTLGVGIANVRGSDVAIFAPMPNTIPNLVVTNHSSITAQEAQNAIGYANNFSMAQMQSSNNFGNFNFSTNAKGQLTGVTSKSIKPDLFGSGQAAPGQNFGSKFNFATMAFAHPNLPDETAYTTMQDWNSKTPAERARITRARKGLPALATGTSATPAGVAAEAYGGGEYGPTGPGTGTGTPSVAPDSPQSGAGIAATAGSTDSSIGGTIGTTGSIAAASTYGGGQYGGPDAGIGQGSGAAVGPAGQVGALGEFGAEGEYGGDMGPGGPGPGPGDGGDAGDEGGLGIAKGGLIKRKNKNKNIRKRSKGLASMY